MTMSARRRRAHDKLAALPGVRSVRRPVTPDAGECFDLYYARSGPPGSHPVVVIPGGPGMSSIAAYQGLRRQAADQGIDVIMVEHRGVGLSRHDDSGADLPAEALTIVQVVDDIAAVLDDAGVDTAAVYGTSYGTYLAAGACLGCPVGRYTATAGTACTACTATPCEAYKTLLNVLGYLKRGRDLGDQ